MAVSIGVVDSIDKENLIAKIKLPNCTNRIGYTSLTSAEINVDVGILLDLNPGDSVYVTTKDYDMQKPIIVGKVYNKDEEYVTESDIKSIKSALTDISIIDNNIVITVHRENN